MREIAAVACNGSLSPRADNSLVPMVELIILTTEPTYTMDGSGELIRSWPNELRQSRFVVGMESLGIVIEKLTEFLDTAKADAKRFGCLDIPDTKGTNDG